jgi:hypothetical protein
MSEPERFEVLILGSGQGGKLLAWHMARLGRDGRRGAPLDRRVLSYFDETDVALPFRISNRGGRGQDPDRSVSVR